jgi:hypothetical protein
MHYSEYIDNGVGSSAVPHIVSGASLVYGFELASRLSDARVQSFMRHLSLACRLHNDLSSIEKERREGCLANAALLMDKYLPPEMSRRFVEEEMAGYERMLNEDIASLGEADPLSILARVMPYVHVVLYAMPRSGYVSA